MEKSICIFGDSVTYGANDWASGGWANMLRRYIDQMDDPKWKPVYVLGIPGNTSKDLFSRFSAEASARDSDIVLTAIGINDLHTNSLNGDCQISLEEFQNNIENLIKLSKNITKNSIFLSLYKVDESKTLPISYPDKTIYFSNQNVNKYNELLNKICLENSVSIINIDGILNPENLDDGLHPNFEGHEKIFQAVKNFLIYEKLT